MSVHDKEEDESYLRIYSSGIGGNFLDIFFKGEKCHARAVDVSLAIRAAIISEVKQLHGRL
jgi:hypothetical protein